MIVGVDCGYGYTKAISEIGEKLKFPSVIGTGVKHKIGKLGDVHSETDHYDLVIKGETNSHYFVGNRAILHSPDARRPFSDNRSNPDEIKPALLTAVAVLGKGNPVTLVTGLPLEPFFKQAKQLKEALEKISGVKVIVDGKPANIEFNQVIMFPQSVAALYGQLLTHNLGDSGLVGIIDVGHKTTIISLYDLAAQEFLDGYDSTIMHGMNDLVVGVQDEIRTITGYEPELEIIEQALVNSKTLHFDRKEFDVVTLVKEREEAFRDLIASNVLRRWRTKLKNLKIVYMTGGGASIIQPVISKFANSEIIQDSQFANARGYLLRGISLTRDDYGSATA